MKKTILYLILLVICKLSFGQLTLFTPSTTTPCTHEVVDFQAHYTYLTAYTRIWNFGDGSPDTTSSTSVSHRYSQAGSFNPQVRFDTDSLYKLVSFTVHAYPSGWQEPGFDTKGPDLKAWVYESNGQQRYYKFRRNTRRVLPQRYPTNKYLNPAMHFFKLEEKDTFGQNDPMGTLNFDMTQGSGRDTVSVNTSQMHGNLVISWVIEKVPSLPYSKQLTVSTTQTAPPITALGNTQLCEGDSLFLSIPHTPGFQAQWQRDGIDIPQASADSLLIKTSGVYTVTPAGVPCFSGNSISATFSPVPSPSIQSFRGIWVDTLVCNLTGSSYQYQWYHQGSAITGATSSSYHTHQGGRYTVKVTNAAGCSDTASQPLHTTVAIDPQQTQGLALQIWPNPIEDKVKLRFDFKGKKAVLELIDIQGKIHISRQLAQYESEDEWDLTGFAAGIYLLRLKTEDGKMTTVNLVKK